MRSFHFQEIYAVCLKSKQRKILLLVRRHHSSKVTPGSLGSVLISLLLFIWPWLSNAYPCCLKYISQKNSLNLMRSFHFQEIYTECLQREQRKVFTIHPLASLQRANTRELGRCVDLSAVAHLEMAFQCLSLLPKVYFSEKQPKLNEIHPFQPQCSV